MTPFPAADAAITQSALLGQPEAAAGAAAVGGHVRHEPSPGQAAFYAVTGALAGCATGLLGVGAVPLSRACMCALVAVLQRGPYPGEAVRRN